MKKNNVVKIIIAIVIMRFVFVNAKEQLKNYNLNQVIYLLSELEITRIIVILILAFITVTTMTLYDYFLINHLKHKLPFLQIWKISWISNTFNNFLSFAGMTGATIRTILYKRNKIATKEAIYASAILVPSTVIGISIGCWLIIFNILKARSILYEFKILWLGIVGYALYLPIYMLLYRWEWLRLKIMVRIKEYDKSLGKLRRALVLSSFIEWVSIGMLFWFICLTFTNEIIIAEALGILSVSAIAGILSFIPGGMGSFDLICILGLEYVGAAPDTAMAILVAFRVFYYIIPWFLGIILGISEIILKKH